MGTVILAVLLLGALELTRTRAWREGFAAGLSAARIRHDAELIR